jgi:hypothetical protein
MPHIDPVDSRWGFYWPFYETRKGQIYALGTPKDDVRDGLALAQIVRLFPLHDFEGIVVEPSRPTIPLVEKNLIFLGSSQLFVDPDAHQISGAPPLSIGDDKLGERLRRIKEQCCYRFKDQEKRALVNTVTGEAYVPARSARADSEVDFGVIRRLFRGPSENTIILEGVHRLGTLGAAKVATERVYLDAIWAAVTQIDGFDEAQPLEILVQSMFKPKQNQVYAIENIAAEPLAVVYSRRWAYDLNERRRWKDQLPWDINLLIEEDAPARAVVWPEHDPPVPRLEIQADLRGLDDATRRLCRDVLPGGNGVPIGKAPARQRSSPEAARRLLLDRLTAKSDLFHIELVDTAPWATKVRSTELPDKGHTPIRRQRKQFLTHLALGRALGEAFRCDDNSVRRVFPQFKLGASAKSLASQFIGSVVGRMRDGFRPLLGDAGRDREYVEIEHSRKDRTYTLRLNRAALMLKFRV